MGNVGLRNNCNIDCSQYNYRLNDINRKIKLIQLNWLLHPYTRNELMPYYMSWWSYNTRTREVCQSSSMNCYSHRVTIHWWMNEWMNGYSHRMHQIVLDTLQYVNTGAVLCNKCQYMPNLRHINNISSLLIKVECHTWMDDFTSTIVLCMSKSYRSSVNCQLSCYGMED
jgi:hypothetical protein